MSGQVALEQMMANKANNKLDRSDQVFIAFLGLVGTTLEEMATLNRFEPMIAKLESVSNRISREIFTYWTQNETRPLDLGIQSIMPMIVGAAIG